MNKSKVIQIILLCFALLIFTFTYYTFFQNKSPTYSNKLKGLDLEEEKIVDLDTSSIINNLSYKNVDYKGNIFVINAETTKLFEDKKGINYMEVVVTNILLIDGRKIEIHSDNAIYDNNNYNTKFFDNVTIVENQNIITSDNLDFFFDENLVTIYNDVKYKGYNKLFVADKVNINLLDQKIDIVMNNKMDKVKINFNN